MVPWLRRRRLSVSSLAFAGWARRFCRARDPRTTVARSVSGRVRRHDVAREYGARTAKEWLPLTLIGLGRTRSSGESRCEPVSSIRAARAAPDTAYEQPASTKAALLTLRYPLSAPFAGV